MTELNGFWEVAVRFGKESGGAGEECPREGLQLLWFSIQSMS